MHFVCACDVLCICEKAHFKPPPREATRWRGKWGSETMWEGRKKEGRKERNEEGGRGTERKRWRGTGWHVDDDTIHVSPTCHAAMAATGVVGQLEHRRDDGRSTTETVPPQALRYNQFRLWTDAAHVFKSERTNPNSNPFDPIVEIMAITVEPPSRGHQRNQS